MMARNLLDLANSIKKRKKELAILSSETSKKVAFQMLKHLTLVTPVDTSKALSNWQLSIGEPAQSEREAFFLGSKGSTKFASASKTVAEASSVLKSKKPGQSIWISNLADYIVDLNNGSSRQHPGGFVDSALIVGRETLKKVTG